MTVDRIAVHGFSIEETSFATEKKERMVIAQYYYDEEGNYTIKDFPHDLSLPTEEFYKRMAALENTTTTTTTKAVWSLYETATIGQQGDHGNDSNLSWLTSYIFNGNSTFLEHHPIPVVAWHDIVILIVLGVLTLSTMFANLLLIYAIAKHRALRHAVYNRMVLSMAISGFLVSIFVMPIALLYDFAKNWLLGDILCTAFVVVDVNLCTASIFHLVSIAIDRYYAATKVMFFQQRRRNINRMLIFSWFGAFLLSILPGTFLI